MLDKSQKIIKVNYLNCNEWKWSGKDYYYFIPVSMEIPKTGVLMLCSSVQNKSMDLKFPLVKIKEVIEPEVRLEGTTDTMTENPLFKEFMEVTVKPFYVTEIKGLDKYFESVDKQYELLELEAEMDKAAAKVEKYTKYKAMAEVNPEFKEKLDRYNELMGFTNVKTLNEVKVENSNED